ncbi:MAG: 50S ribosomal protein L6 [Flavobacteriales bacterium]|nr:50S ribosomal protein L6 [Flavobacteriales bacterium]NNK79894.1 50S ribosomal protein L6 [Flavobacteriales bacterium]
MSRIGNAPITIPAGVDVNFKDHVVTVKGPKGELTQSIDPSISVKVEDGTISCSRTSEVKQVKAYHGLYRSLINNMIEGVTNGFKTEQELVGVGYRAQVAGQLLTMNLGFSHPVVIEMPKEIKVAAETQKGKNPIVTLESADKQLVGHVAAKIRSLRKPEPYKGKGIKYVGEHIRRKAGKTAAK